MLHKSLPLTQRLLAVKTALAGHGISKSSRAPDSMGKFKYRGIDATMNLISKLHAENGVLVRLEGIYNKVTKEIGKMTRTEADLCFEFYSSDNKQDTIQTWALGEGKDSGDKVGGKVHSYGYKNAMFTFYEIPTESQEIESYDPRIDNESEDVSEGGGPPSNAAKSDNKITEAKPGAGQGKKKETPKAKEPDVKAESDVRSGDIPDALGTPEQTTGKDIAIPSPEEGKARMMEIASLIKDLNDSNKISELVAEARWLRDDLDVNGDAFELVRKQAKLAHVRNNTPPAGV